MSTNINLKNSTDTTFSITHSDGANTKVLDSKDIAVAIDTVADFPSNPNNGDVVIVRDLNRGGTFIYDSSEVAGSNDGTNFDGWIRQYSGAVNVKWFGANETRTNNEVPIQAAIDLGDNISIYFPSGVYKLEHIEFKYFGQQIYFDNAYIQASSNTYSDAIVHLNNNSNKLIGLKIDGAYKTNYKCALRWYAQSGSIFAGKCTIEKLNIYNSKIGVLYGDLTFPIDAPVSENNLINYVTRGVEQCFYSNQPNGFINISNSVLDCMPYEFVGFDDNIATCVYNKYGYISLSQINFIKATSVAGYGITNIGTNSIINIYNSQAEVASTNLRLLDYSKTFINGYFNNFWNNATTSFCSINNSLLHIDNFNITKGVGAENAINEIFDGTYSENNNITILNGTLDRINPVTVLKNISTENIVFKNTQVTHLNYLTTIYPKLANKSDYNYAISLHPSTHLNYNIVAWTGTETLTTQSISHKKYTKAVQLSSIGGSYLYVSNPTLIKVDLDSKYKVLQITSAVTSATSGFNCAFDVLCFDEEQNYLGNITLSSAGSLGHLQTISGVQPFKTDTFIVAMVAKTAFVKFQFGIDVHQSVLQIADISIY